MADQHQNKRGKNFNHAKHQQGRKPQGAHSSSEPGNAGNEKTRKQYCRQSSSNSSQSSQYCRQSSSSSSQSSEHHKGKTATGGYVNQERGHQGHQVPYPQTSKNQKSQHLSHYESSESSSSYKPQFHKSEGNNINHSPPKIYNKFTNQGKQEQSVPKPRKNLYVPHKTQPQYSCQNEGDWVVVREQENTCSENHPGKNRRPNRFRQQKWKQKKRDNTLEPGLMNFARDISQSAEQSISEFGSDSESVAGSEFSSSQRSVHSSVAAAGVSFQSVASVHSQAKGVIGVFWDIENCSVPKGKSPREIVKKIRDTFYGCRKEEGFTVACDISKLTANVRKELTSAHVDLLHVDCDQKNAADAKLREYLRRFVEVPKPEGSCIVLISGDIDFGTELHNLRYRNQIYIVLIHNRSAKRELLDLANEVILFDAFVKGFSSLNTKEKVFKPEYLLLENIPQHIAGKAFLMLRQVVPHMNGTIKTKIENGCCLLEFPNKDEASKAFSYFTSNKVGFFDNPETKITVSVEKPELKPPQASVSVTVEVQSSSVGQEGVTDQEKENSSPGMKSAVLWLESETLHGAEFWKSFFRNIIKVDTFKDVTVDNKKVCVLFESLNAAKRMRKVLQTEQNTELKVQGVHEITDEETMTGRGQAEPKTVASLIENTKSFFEKKHAQLLKEHNKKKSEVETELSSVLKVMSTLPSSTKPSDFETFSVAVQSSESRLVQLDKQENIFSSILVRNINTLDGYVSSGMPFKDVSALIDIMKKEFNQECGIFSQTLPLYAYKAEVIELIQKNSVSVILADTSSGKSTLIPQFLYQAGFSEKGRIACTQPESIPVQSLALHVSNQMGSTVGKLVGFQMGLLPKSTEETRIMYTTHLNILSECYKDSTLKSYSTIIVDEVHERTVLTDILLGVLKKIISQRPQLKVVLLSAKPDIEILQKYFNIGYDAVLNISGAVYPNEVIWGYKTVNINADYVGQSVTKAFEIHVSEEPGHILVFLAVASDTIKACNMFANLKKPSKHSLNALCLPLHDKISTEEQNKIFSNVSHQTRKIIFATSCAETSMTVPGIRYVVDTGMVLEKLFDSKCLSDVIKISLASRNNVDQRKGHAGITQACKCFRLFSKESYESMAEDFQPEIYRINLGQAFLILMELGIENPCTFEFIECPKPGSFLATMQCLSSLGILENDRLNELGHKMAKLSLEPSVSKLVVRGFQEGVGYESVIFATFASISRMCFFWVDENKSAGELLKANFGQDGDFHTFLEVFKKYIMTPKAKKSEWCQEHCVNETVMKIANDGVRELLQACEQQLGFPLSTAYSSKPDVNKILQYLILEAFVPNICIYSGHKSTGYISLKNQEPAHLHPSSSMSYLERDMPKYAVYQMRLLTVKEYIVNVTPVSEDTLLKAIDNGLYPKGTVEKMEDFALTALTFGPFGSRFLRNFCGTGGKERRKLEDKITKKTNGNFASVIMDYQVGKISVCCKKQFHPQVKTILDEYLAEVVVRMKSENDLITLDGNSEGINYLLSAGAEICEVIMPGEFTKFRVHNLDPSFDQKTLAKICDGSNKPYTLVEESGKSLAEILITFKDVRAAMITADQIPKILKCEVTSFACLTSQDKVIDPLFQVLVTWVRRPVKGYAFIDFENDQDYQTYAPKILSSTTIAGSFLVQKSNKKGNQLFVTRIPNQASSMEVKRTILRDLGSEVKCDLKVPCENQFKTSDEDVETVIRDLEDLFSLYTHKDNIIVDVDKPHERQEVWRAEVSFRNSRDGQMAYNVLKDCGKYPGTDYKLSLTVEVTSTIVCHRNIFDIAKLYLEDAVKVFSKGKKSDDNLKIEAHPSKTIKDLVVISLQSNNVVDIEWARKVFHRVLTGERIECLGVPLSEKLFMPTGRNELNKIEKQKGTKIHLDFLKKTITILGKEQARADTKHAVYNYLSFLEILSSKVISFAYPNKPRGFLKLMLQQYNSDFSALLAASGLFSVDLVLPARSNIPRLSIVLFGSRESIENAENMLNALGNICNVDKADGESCTVCFSLLSENKSHYRLQCCGHAYCGECLSLQIRYDTIPMICVAEGCGEPFVVADYKQLPNIEMKSSVAKASLRHLVGKRRKEFRFCPTPECPVVYRIPTDPSTPSMMTCRICTNQICTRCHAQYHNGYSCNMYQKSYEGDDYPVKEWLKENHETRTQCRMCGVGIERNGSSNHLSCWSCSAHFCWLCLSIFSNLENINNHMLQCKARR